MGAPYSGLMFAVRMTLAHFSGRWPETFQTQRANSEVAPIPQDRRGASEIAKLISYLHVAGQDQCRCDRFFSAIVTGAGTTRKGRQRLAYSRFRGQSGNQNRQVKLPLTEWSCARLASWPA